VPVAPGVILRGVAPGNAELMRQAYAGLADDVDQFIAMLHPDAEWHWPRGVADKTVFRGRDEIRRGIEQWSEPWEDFRMERVEFLERGEDVLAVVRYRARGRASGMDIDQEVVHLVEFRDGLAVRLRMFGDVEKAKRRFTEGR
jgi:ketosteroid isomerase-like protein